MAYLHRPKVRYGIIALLILDALTKYFFYNLGYSSAAMLNVGISWSLPLGVAIVIPVTILVIARGCRAWAKRGLSDFIFVFFVSGAVGNLIDRIMFSGVRDFISVGTFPVFNVSDVLLNIAVVAFVLEEMFANGIIRESHRYKALKIRR